MKKIIIPIVFILVALFLLLVVIRTDESIQSDSGEKKVVVTNYALESLTSLIAQDNILIEEAFDFSKELHSGSNITSKNMENMLEADVIFCISDKYESFIKDIEKAVASGQSDVQIVQMSDYLDIDGDLANEHIWLSPKEGLIMNEAIYNTLKEIDSSNEALYRENYENNKKQLTFLDKQYSEFAKSNTKTIFVEHDAYYWLNQDYGLNIIGINGASHESEISAQDIERVIETIESEQIQTIYNESKTNIDQAIRVIQDETDVDIEYLNTLEIKSDENYIDSLEKNLEKMKRV